MFFQLIISFLPPLFMVDMMNGSALSFSTLWMFHILSVIAAGVGTLFLVVFAIRTFSEKKLLHWGIWLAVIGTVVCLITIAVRGGPWMGGYQQMKMMRGNMGQMMQMMMDHDTDEPNEDHGPMMDMMRMMNQGGSMMMDDDDAPST